MLAPSTTSDPLDAKRGPVQVTSGKAGDKPVFHIFATLAKFERGVVWGRTLAGLRAAWARGRLGGRPPALAVKDLAVAKAMLKDPGITVAEVAGRLGVAASTLYRHLPRARTAALES